jgi:hypothetical protein
MKENLETMKMVLGASIFRISYLVSILYQIQVFYEIVITLQENNELLRVKSPQ